TVPVARAALQAGATWLGVALVEEGLALREAGIDAPTLVLTEFPPGSEEAALRADLTPTIYSEDGLSRLAVATDAAAGTPGVHVKVDTGMHRVGLPPDRAIELVGRLDDAGLGLQGLWTHFAKSEEMGDDFTARQLGTFRRTVEELSLLGHRPRYLHAANSGAVLAHPESHLDLVRVGIAMYGVAPGLELPGVPALRPALSWKSAVSLVKRVGAGEGVSYGLRFRAERATTIATVPVGYADGYPRSLTNRGPVLIGGRRLRVAGTVTMDQLMVDCEDDPVEVGDEVVLIGRQGAAEVRAEELAELTGTIGYEIVCGVSERVPREYLWA
ncbi:MAG: alanine racemase, partial [Actinobacteria bacterium]|nr:alanine racemase [Actinomycetota bacterium]